MYSFLEEDYAKLGQQIEDLKNKVREIGKDMGASCQEGAETFHDNFAYEDGERNQKMYAQRVRDLTHIKDRARIVPRATPGKVGIGRTVTYVDAETNEEHSLRIGSYMTFDDDAAAYNSPIAKLLIGASIGDERKGVVGGDFKVFRVTSIT